MVLGITGLALAQDTMLQTGSSASTGANYRITAPYNPTTKVTTTTVTSSLLTAPAGTTWIADGDSTTQSPNGAGVTSWFALLSTGTFPANDWFSAARCFNIAQGGGIISNGTSATVSGLPQNVTVSAATSGATVLAITSGSAYQLGSNNGSPIPMGVFGPNIPFGCTGAITNSGTTLTLSAATSGTLAASTAIRLGGNNAMDRFPSQAAPHAPTAFGGDGGTGPVYYSFQGFANCLRGNEPFVNIQGDILALSATARAYGMIPVWGTQFPTGLGGPISTSYGPVWWNATAELVRQSSNQWLTSGSSGDYIVDTTRGFNGAPVSIASSYSSAYLDGNGIHPMGPTNGMIAVAWNSQIKNGFGSYNAQPQFNNDATEFQQSIKLDNGITISSTGAYILPITQPNLGAGGIQQIQFGTADTSGFNQSQLMFVYTGSNSSANVLSLGISNANPGIVINNGGNTPTGEVAIGYSIADAQAVMNGSQKLAIKIAPNTEDGIDVSSVGTVPNFFFISTMQPNIASTDYVNGVVVGEAKSGNNCGILSFYNAGVNSANNSFGFQFFTGLNYFREFPATGDVLIGPGLADNGFMLEVNGTAKVDSNLTVSGTITGNGSGLTNLPPSTGGTASAVTGGTSNAPSGQVGEFVTTVTGSASPIAMTSGSATIITSGTLTAGVWDVTGVVGYHEGTSTVSTYFQEGTAVGSGTLTTLGNYASDSVAMTTTIDVAKVVPVAHYVLTTTGTVNLIGQAGFSVSTMGAYGYLRCLRVH